MSSNKKLIRKYFRDACFLRDKYRCAVCKVRAASKDNPEKDLDAHHITDRSVMPNGGYVKENGISLCSDCHKKAEIYHSTGVSHPGFAPDDLYKIINSNLELAIIACEKLTNPST
jgi:5-methylcytosine-specific restriction endonuclease McrA